MNRLAEVRNGDGSFQKNRYDGEGLRAELEENGRLVSFIFDGDKVVTEEEDQNTIRYIRGYDLISSDSERARTYYHYACDEMGSITHITDEAGNVLNRYEYDAFGEFICKEETVANRFAYTGEQYDPVAGMYYLRARFYNPVIGRFLQEDTYYGDGLNLYAYCRNNPVGYVDPSGHICQDKYQSIEYLRKTEGLTAQEALERYKEYRRANPKLSPEALRRKIEGRDKNNRTRRNMSLREQYMGRTPGKKSRTGREVIARMMQEKKISEDGKMFKYKDNWYNIEDADMGHRTDAVKWWNRTGRFSGAKSRRVRNFMLNSHNYELQPYWINRSEGAKLRETYLPPL